MQTLQALGGGQQRQLRRRRRDQEGARPVVAQRRPTRPTATRSTRPSGVRRVARRRRQLAGQHAAGGQPRGAAAGAGGRQGLVPDVPARPAQPGDAAGKLVEQIRRAISTTRSPVRQADGLARRVRRGRAAGRRAVRDIVGEQSPEWQTLQQGMVRRIVFGDANKQAIDLQPGEQAWKTMDTRISQALEGRGAGWPSEMLGADATTRLRELREIAPRQGGQGEGRQPVGLGLRGERAGRGIVDKAEGGPRRRARGYLGRVHDGRRPRGRRGRRRARGRRPPRAGRARPGATRGLRRLLRPLPGAEGRAGDPGLPPLSPASAAPAGAPVRLAVRSGEALMPLTAAGRRTLRKLVLEHGAEKGKAHLLRHGEQSRQREVEKGRDRQAEEGEVMAYADGFSRDPAANSSPPPLGCAAGRPAGQAHLRHLPHR
jgi:hypothetical protein